MTDYKQLVTEIEREIEGAFSKCTQVDGVLTHTSQFGERYRRFQLSLGSDSYETLDNDTIWTLRSAVKGALEGWLAQGCGPVCVWRTRPNVKLRTTEEGVAYGLEIYFRCHFMSTEAYEHARKLGIDEPILGPRLDPKPTGTGSIEFQVAPVKPVENSA